MDQTFTQFPTFFQFRFITDSQKKSHTEEGEDSEVKREEFRHPRNCLLNFAADFYKLCSGKLNEINKVRSNFSSLGASLVSIVKSFGWELIENCICYGSADGMMIMLHLFFPTLFQKLLE